MDWKAEAIESLRNYEAKKQALITIPLQIAEIESSIARLHSRIGIASNEGGGIADDEKLIGCIVKKEELRMCLERTQLFVDAVDSALSILSPNDRHILTVMYINRETGYKEHLMLELGIEERGLYKRVRRILQRFIYAMYGHPESQISSIKPRVTPE